MNATDVVQAVLPKRARQDLAVDIVDALDEAGHLMYEPVESVEVVGARVSVETVEVHGLTISLDANGNAVRITSPWGLVIA